MTIFLALCYDSLSQGGRHVGLDIHCGTCPCVSSCHTHSSFSLSSTEGTCAQPASWFVPLPVTMEVTVLLGSRHLCKPTLECSQSVALDGPGVQGGPVSSLCCNVA